MAVDDQDIVDLKAAIAEAEATGDYRALNRMIRPTGTPEPTELSIRSRNVTLEEIASACETMRALKEGDDFAALHEAQEIVSILRAAYREGEIEANRRSHGVGVNTEEY